MAHLGLITILLLAYLAITESLAIGNVVVGLAVAVLITLLVRPRWVPLRPRRIPGVVWALLSYVALLAVEIIRNGLFVARVVLRPSLRIRSAIVAVPSESESEIATAVLAHGITVSPGELVVEIDNHQVMYVHCLDLRVDPQALIEGHRRRKAMLSRIIE